MSDWHHLGKWVEPALAAELWLEYASYAQQFFKGKLDGRIMFLNGDFFLWQKDVDMIAQESYAAAKNKDEDFFKRIELKIRQVTKSLKDSVHKIESVVDFLQAYKELTGIWMPINPIAIGVERFVQETNPKDFDISKGLTYEKSWTMQQVEEIRSIKKQIGFVPEDEAAIPEQFRKIVLDHVKKYEWLGSHHFNIKEFTLKELLDRMKTDEEEPESSVEMSGDDEYLVQLLDMLGFLRFRCAETTGYVTFYLKPYLQKMAEKHDLTYEDIVEHMIWEIAGQNLKKEIANSRKENFGMFYDGKEHILSAGEIKKYESLLLNNEGEETTELKGLVAFKGSAKGEVKIVTCQEDMIGFEKGMILVAYETTPDIVIAMEKSAAIVTDFGGLTSHAAIVARELKIPCIVGTRYATKFLKNGDLIDVDAEKGVVKRLK